MNTLTRRWRHAGPRFTRLSLLLMCIALIPLFSTGSAAAKGRPQVSASAVLTYHNDLMRTGQNRNEVSLTTQNVNPTTFGKVASFAVDGQIYAQPLYMPGVSIP